MNLQPERIVLVDLRIPFFRLVLFFIKAGLAVIPAAIIVGFIMMVLSACLIALLGGTPTILMRRWTF